MINRFVEKVNSIGQLAKKKNKNSALFITDFLVEEGKFIFNTINESNIHLYGYCEMSSIELTKTLIEKIDGLIEYIILDIKIYQQVEQNINIKQSKIFIYNDEKCWSDSIVSLLYTFRRKHSFSNVLIGGNSVLTNRIINDVRDMSDNISSLNYIKHDDINNIKKDSLAGEKFDLVISTNYKQICFDDTFMDKIDYSTFIIDAGISGFSKNFIKKHYELNSTIIRMDNRAALSSILTSILENEDLCKNVMGEFTYEGIRVVAGGIMGMENDVIVDNISMPSVVIGMSSGDGQTLYDVEENTKVQKIKKVIKHNAV
jgi:hypothetical protein